MVKNPEILELKKRVLIKPTAPFLFDATFHKPDHFTTGDNIWQPGIRWQTWLHNGTPLGLRFSNKGSVSKPLLEVGIYSSKSLSKEFIDSLVQEIKYRYNLELDLKDFYKKFKTDKVLGPAIKRLKGMRPGHPSSLYEYLIIGVVLQNATVRRSIQMFQTLLFKYGKFVKFPAEGGSASLGPPYGGASPLAGRAGGDKKELWCFWQPGRLSRATVDDLRKLKVGYRAKSIKKIDDAFRDELINETELRQKDRETQRQELLKLYGVGPATVWYLLFDVFHHWDVFDHISPWEQKIYSKLWFDRETTNPVSVKKLLQFINKYGKYKHLAVHYFWEDLWWRHKKKPIAWLVKEIRT